MVIATYRIDWQYLSRDHEKIDNTLSKIINDYAANKLDHFAYAIIGTFGVGKTQLLYHIHKLAISNGLIPLYFIAEDLFKEVISNYNKVFTPGDIFTLIEEKVRNLKEALSVKEEDKVRKILDPRGKLRTDAPEIVDSIINKFSGSNTDNLKVILLIDELEGQYSILQNRVQTSDRSPLREWLEAKNHLKFLAFAPAGIYELGSADITRIKRIVLPAVDIRYVRDKLINSAGRSNACWWLSRGKARQLFKACETLKDKDSYLDSAQASRIIKNELDSIGQPPTLVPAAVTDAISASQIPSLLYLCPVKGEKIKQYVIDTKRLDTGTVADKLVDAFHIRKENAMLISEYFKRTVEVLSDDDYVTYIQEEDLPELFCLVFDHLLEYELGNPELSTTIGEILNLYERVKKEHAALHGDIGRLWERKETELRLPLTIEQIRNTFPFPSMNPIVKSYEPTNMRKKWEGKGFPIWKWVEGDITVLFFASERDLVSYCATDEFASLALPDGKGVLCCLGAGENFREDDIFLAWLRRNNKFSFVELPPLLTDFLLSASGDIQANIPDDLQLHLRNFKDQKEDILLSRKSDIYTAAINEIIKCVLPKPETFYKGPLPDTDTIWGKGRMEREVAITAVSIALADLTAQERQLLADLRELFRSGKEGRGSGDLNPLMPRVGYTTIADDILPRYVRKELRDSEPAGRLKSYWREAEKDNLGELARILPREHFLKLHSDEDMNRLLEALWKTVRKDFELTDFNTNVQELERAIVPALEDCLKLEQEASNDFGLSGIKFEELEKLVKATNGVKKLLEIVKDSLKDTGSNATLVRSVVNAFMGAVIGNIEKDVRNLTLLYNSTKNSLDALRSSADNVKRNFWEYPKAVRFVGLSEDIITTIVSEQMTIRDTHTLTQLESLAKERKEYLENLSRGLNTLETKLNELASAFSQAKKES